MHVTIRAMTLVLPLQKAEHVASGAIDMRAESLFPGYHPNWERLTGVINHARHGY